MLERGSAGGPRRLERQGPSQSRRRDRMPAERQRAVRMTEIATGGAGAAVASCQQDLNPISPEGERARMPQDRMQSFFGAT
jgi:hypothetical protein